MSDSSDALKRDAIVLMIVYIGLYIYILITKGYSQRMTISLCLDALMLGGIIHYADTNERLAGILGLIFSVLLFASGSIIGIVLSLFMGYRSIRCILD